MNSTGLKDLPKNLLIQYALEFDLPTLSNLCRSGKYYNDTLCNNEEYWEMRLNKDYGKYGHQPKKVVGKKGDLSWKQYYQIVKQASEYPAGSLYALDPILSGPNKLFIESARDGNSNIVQVLLNDTRVDPAIEHNEAIRFASLKGHPEVVKLLLQDSRVDPTTMHNDAITMASEGGHIEVVRLLLEDPRVDPSDDENSAREWARANYRFDILELLQSDPRYHE